jgi:hypothetical protein
MTKETQLPFDLGLPRAMMLKAGTLTCMYEAGNLRYICLGKTELVRKIYGAVRNENWTTIPCKIQDEIVTNNESGFTIKYTAVYSLDTDLYKADYLIEGKADDTISFSMKGTALADFKKNRIGLCLHHPLKECRGKNAIVTRPDGTVYQKTFPRLVSPSLPFLEMRQLQWISENNIMVQLNFEGDVFETEDQRNWADASYKTYSTRSDTPKPTDVKTGDTIEQKITLKISGATGLSITASQKESREVRVPFPLIGYSRSFNDSPGVAATMDWLIKIPFDHYRVSVHMNQNEWLLHLQQSLSEAAGINTKLELVVFFSDSYKNEILQLVSELKEKQLLVRSILVLHKDHNVSPAELLQYLYPVIKAELPAVKIGYGTDAIFVDVNQNPPGQLTFDFISFGIHPQAHAFDNRSILENLQSQPDIIKTAMNISGGQPVCISPITLSDRNSGADERLQSFMVALWTLVSLQNFSEAYSITFYELFGAEGLLFSGQQDESNGIIKPSPLYDLLVTIFNFQPVWVIKRFIGDELLMDGLLLENQKGERLFFKATEEYRVAAACLERTGNF